MTEKTIAAVAATVKSLTVNPTSDITADWPFTTPSGGTHFSKIDEGISSADQTDFVETRGIDKTDEFGYEDSPIDFITATDIDVVMHMFATDDVLEPGLRVSLHSGGSEIVAKNFGPVANIAWRTLVFSFTGLLITKTQFDDLSPRMKSQGFPVGDEEIPTVE